MVCFQYRLHSILNGYCHEKLLSSNAKEDVLIYENRHYRSINILYNMEINPFFDIISVNVRETITDGF